MFRNVAVACLLSMTSLVPCFGQSWAQEMFSETTHHFGTVASDAKAEYAFVVSNPFVEDVHIAAVRSSCSCTSPRIEKPWLKTHQKGAIIAKINTQAFRGRKRATITVTIDKPYRAEVQLHVSSHIRGDVVLEPGSVQFGSVDHGQPAQQTARITYLGRGDWEIQEVRSANEHLSAEITKTSSHNGRNAYELTVRMDADAPVGYFNDHLTLVTSDARQSHIPVLVEGRVTSNVTVSPASLFMGVVGPGHKVTKRLVVRGKRPFRILSIRCQGQTFAFDTDEQAEPKPLHLIPVTFIAGEHPGEITDRITIETDLGEEIPALPASAVVSPDESDAPEEPLPAVAKSSPRG